MSAAADELAGCRILVVEDEYFVAAEMAQAFEARGAEVLGPVGTVAGALEIVAAAPRIDRAVLDLNLQGEMAFPVADALRARGIRFVFVTGYDTAAIPAGYAEVEVLQKPTDPARIARALLA